MGVVFFPSLPFMGVMLFPSFVLGNASGEGGAFLVPLSLFSILLSLSLISSLFRTNSFHPFFLLLLFSTSFSFPFSFLRVFFFLREVLVLCNSEVYWMTLLIVIECNLIGIKRDFSFLIMNLHIMLYVIFPSILCLSCLRCLIK